MANTRSFWEIVQDIDPEYYERAWRFREYVLADGAMPSKYKELVALAISCDKLYTQGMLRHASRALVAGASRREIFEVIALLYATSGGAVFANAVEILGSILCEVTDDHH